MDCDYRVLLKCSFDGKPAVKCGNCIAGRPGGIGHFPGFESGPRIDRGRHCFSRRFGKKCHLEPKCGFGGPRVEFPRIPWFQLQLLLQPPDPAPVPTPAPAPAPAPASRSSLQLKLQLHFQLHFQLQLQSVLLVPTSTVPLASTLTLSINT